MSKGPPSRPTALRASTSDPAWLKDAFVQIQANLGAAIRLASHSISHAGVMGSVNEEHWLELFRQYLPNRYDVATGIVIDSQGNRSDQIDLVVFDRHFTPTLLTQKNHRYIPAEAVYGVFECKPVIDKAYLAYAQDKAASVRRMHRTSVAISYTPGTPQFKPHFRVLAGILAPNAVWADGLGEAFERNLSDDPERVLGFYPDITDTSVKPHHGAGGVSCNSEGSTAKSSSVRRLD